VIQSTTGVCGGNETALFQRNMSPFSWTGLSNLRKKNATFVFEQVEEFTLQQQEREILLH
jgi:hypothetical protein